MSVRQPRPPWRALGRVRVLPAAALPAVLMAAWVMFTIAWIWANPLGSAPDEVDHYIRAVGAGQGDLVGTPAPLAASDPQIVTGGRRYFRIPAGLDVPRQFACNAFRATEASACFNIPESPSTATVSESAAGTYMPTAYLVPGALMRLASDPSTALRLGRIGSALLSLSLLAVALRLLWARAGSSFVLLGMLLVVTPMQIFLVSELGPNGLEIAAAACYSAAIVRLARPGPVSRWHWAGLAYGGVMLAATRPLGPAWLAGGVVVALLLVGPSPVWARFRMLPVTAACSCLAMGAAAAINLWWQSRYPGTTTHVSLHNLLNTYWDSVNDAARLLQEMIGVFGWLDTYLPLPLYLLWTISVLGLAALALLVGTRRQRLLIVLFALASVLLLGLLADYLSLTLGYNGASQGVQGRYLMPLVIWFPLLCGEVLYLNRTRLGDLAPRRLVLTLAGIAAFVQFGSLVVNSRRYAVGSRGPIYFLQYPFWEPPAGWPLWLLLAAFAMVVMAAAGRAGVRPAAAAPAPAPEDAA